MVRDPEKAGMTPLGAGEEAPALSWEWHGRAPCAWVAGALAGWFQLSGSGSSRVGLPEGTPDPTPWLQMALRGSKLPALSRGCQIAYSLLLGSKATARLQDHALPSFMATSSAAPDVQLLRGIVKDAPVHQKRGIVKGPR
jgi:hypothetical protein